MSDTHSETVAYVRETMLPQGAPPASEVGVIKWLRENLFSGVLNTILTVLGIAAVVWLVQAALPWFLHGVWNANSLTECRQIIAETWGEGAHGACWAVIRERWNQFLFGFYPSDLYWRPVLALALFFAAVAPVLFTEMPRKLLWGSAFYPAIAYILLWGGSLWVPISVMAGFGVGWLGLVAARRTGLPLLGPVAVLLLPLLWWLFLAGPAAEMLDRAIPLWVEEVRSDKFGGFVLSLTIGIAAIVLSLPLGIVLALGRRSDMLLVKALSVGFIEFIRGVPLITLLFTASLLLNYFLPPGTNFDIILRVIIMVTLFAAAYIAEVIRGGLAALPRGQYEAADSLGLDYWKAMQLIVLPQALKISIPGIVSTFIGLFKDTTLVIFVGLLDPLKGITDAVRAAIEWKGVYWEPFIFVGAIFFIFNFGMSRYSMYLERKLQRDHR
ncbi:ABC transporter permease subunit [Frigidibacter albus]|uniref:ABC transporter permease subunit n=1 Tax=Frigidibacter albus TaxID=1465486 RepID=A0A6L8VJ48_9RHOB|nr:amino acid ABC transporter permease [Frigidibacter albus]MZQ90355.1 ABC transporter permease subunit [Frigidibacter albus]NBE32147.1 ABC transporter permease subunit [Frigidibacter albus]GGH58939.1 amino acid ABC transporter permease [Frigidibacter albus]